VTTGTFVRWRNYAARDLITVVEALDLPQPLTIVACPDGPGQLLIAGDPALAGIVVRADHAEVGPGIMWWDDGYRMMGMRDPEIIVLPNGLDDAGLAAVQAAVRRSITRRRRGFRRCSTCLSLNPPERMSTRGVCRACADRRE